MNKPKNPLDDESKWPRSFLRLVHPQSEKASPGLRRKQTMSNNEKFEKEFGKNFMPKGPQGLYRDPGFVNPFLKLNELDFYGARVVLSVEDKARVLENELIRDYQMRLHESEEEKEAAL